MRPVFFKMHKFLQIEVAKKQLVVSLKTKMEPAKF